ncbi:uncharacterized protein IL334_004370 [Kwoniella shivajii]|uniref:ASX DEUBAD domain-containing protein n=1 Tax=Kwoniella shivajii TaxID=564305 RepID=A0ABZ1D213_9TREE|nr:hypothetical protein IL334_004370 [Kwoniella shivajii]
MNSSSVRQAASRSTRSLSSKAGPSSSTYPPKKSNGRTLPSSTLRSLISLHHSSAGFLHDPSELNVGFDNTFRHTKGEPFFRGYYDFTSSITFNQSLHPPGGMENLVEKPKSSEARGMDLKGRTILPAENVQKTFKKVEELWSQRVTNNRKDEQFLSDRELRVQEALYGTWERGGTGMEKTEPSLEGVLEFVEAKGKSISEYASEWEKRDELTKKEDGTEDGL